MKFEEANHSHTAGGNTKGFLGGTWQIVHEPFPSFLKQHVITI